METHIKHISVCFFILLSFFTLQSQPLNSSIGLVPNQVKKIIDLDMSFHSSVQPYRLNEVQEIKYFNNKSTQLDNFQRSFKSNLYKKEKDKWALYAQPYLYFTTNLAEPNVVEDENIYGIGFDFSMSYSNKLAIGFTYANNFTKATTLFDDALKNGYYPGMSDLKSHNSNFQRAEFIQTYLSYSPNTHFNFEIGNGKQFIGEGYRSLLLSDNANNSPYLKFTTNFWKLSYTNIWASHQNLYDVRVGLSSSEQKKYKGKYSSSHYLDWNVSKWLSIGLFETVIWSAKDSVYHRGFDVNYLNPIIFYRPVEFSVGSPDNVLIGLNYKIKLLKNNIIYGQLMLDEFLFNEIKADVQHYFNPKPNDKFGWWANKYAIQLGWKTYDLFKINGLSTRFEYNFIRPFTYAHSNAVQSYSNDGQSLAHPKGAGLSEFIVRLNYQRNQLEYYFNYFNLTQAKDPNNIEKLGTNVNYSNSLRTQDYGFEVFNNGAERVQNFQMGFAYRPFQASNLNLFAEYIYRSSSVVKNQNFILLGLRSDLFRTNYER